MDSGTKHCCSVLIFSRPNVKEKIAVWLRETSPRMEPLARLSMARREQEVDRLLLQN